MVVDEAGSVTLVRPACGLIALSVAHDSDRLKGMALRSKTVEEVRQIVDVGGDELIRVGVNWIDESVGRQERFLDELQDAAKVIVDGLMR